MRTLQYFFDFNLSIKHKVDKINIMSNVFFDFKSMYLLLKKLMF